MERFLKFITVLLLISAFQSIGFAQSNNASEMLDALLLNYDARIRPNYGGAPVQVDISAYILDVSSISEANMDFTIDLYFRQTWTDKRLEFTPKDGIATLLLDSSSQDRIWEPDTFFPNSKSASLHQITKPNSFTKIAASGKVLMSKRLKVTASCPMNFNHFPMDSHICKLEIESYGSSAADLVYNWINSLAVGVNAEISLPKFKVVGHREVTQEIKLTTGIYSRLSLEMLFTRSWGRYLIDIFVPAMFLVLLSWTALLIKSSIVRLMIGVLTSLALMSLMSNTNAALPFSSCVKATDVYLVVCLLMTLVSLAISIFVDYLGHAAHEQPSSYKTIAFKNSEKEDNRLDMSLIAEDGNGHRSHCNRTDKISLFALPVVFLIFNILYFTIYANVSDVMPSPSPAS